MLGCLLIGLALGWRSWRQGPPQVPVAKADGWPREPGNGLVAILVTTTRCGYLWLPDVAWKRNSTTSPSRIT